MTIEEKQQLEFFLARCLALHPEIHKFAIRLFQFIAYEILLIELLLKSQPGADVGIPQLLDCISRDTNAGTALPDFAIEKLYQRYFPSCTPDPIFQKFSQVLSFRGFADETNRSNAGEHRSVLLPYQRHGSVGAANVFYFKNLIESSALRFDILLTAISSALCQYRDGIIKKEDSYYSKITSIQHSNFRKRLPETAQVTVPIHEVSITTEEQWLFKTTAPPLSRDYHISGGNTYCLDADYKKTFISGEIPLLTGISGLGGIMFRLFSRFFSRVEDLKLLQQTIIAYLVAKQDHSFFEAVEAINLVVEEQELRDFFIQKYQLDIRQLTLPIMSVATYDAAIKKSFSKLLDSSGTVIQDSIVDILRGDVFPRWLLKLIEITAWRTQKDRKEITCQVRSFLDDFLKIQPKILRTLLLEQQFTGTDKASFVTPLQIMIEIYLAGYFSVKNEKLLANPAIADVVLIQKFGLAHTEAGPMVDEYVLRAAQQRSCYGFEKLIPNTHGAGAILSTRYYSPLMHMVWIFAGIQARQGFSLLKSSNPMINNFNWQAMARQLLERAGYQLTPQHAESAVDIFHLSAESSHQKAFSTLLNLD